MPLLPNFYKTLAIIIIYRERERGREQRWSFELNLGVYLCRCYVCIKVGSMSFSAILSESLKESGGDRKTK